MKSGSASKPSVLRRAPSAHEERSALSLTMAATAPERTKMVVSPSPSQPETTRRRAEGRSPTRSAIGPSATFSGKKHLSSCEKLPLPRVPIAVIAAGAGMP